LLLLGVGFIVIIQKFVGGVVPLRALPTAHIVKNIFGWNYLTSVYYGREAVRTGWMYVTVGTLFLIIGVLTSYFGPVFHLNNSVIEDFIYRNPVQANVFYRIFLIVKVCPTLRT